MDTLVVGGIGGRGLGGDRAAEKVDGALRSLRQERKRRGLRTAEAVAGGGQFLEEALERRDDEGQPVGGVVEATDDAGNPENAAALFDSFFEWNASPY